MPYQFMLPILNSAPSVPRPLRRPEPAKAKKYLELAEVLLNRFPSDTSGRAVEFLVDLVRNETPGVLPALPWYTTPGNRDVIRLGVPRALGRVAPAMVFQARIG